MATQAQLRSDYLRRMVTLIGTFTRTLTSTCTFNPKPNPGPNLNSNPNRNPAPNQVAREIRILQQLSSAEMRHPGVVALLEVMGRGRGRGRG